MIKRYNFEVASQFNITDQIVYVEARPNKNGKYVRYSDYAVLSYSVARLKEALRELLDYTRACEGLLNASESGTCVKARRALEEK